MSGLWLGREEPESISFAMLCGLTLRGRPQNPLLEYTVISVLRYDLDLKVAEVVSTRALLSVARLLSLFFT